MIINKDRIAILFMALRCLREREESKGLDVREITDFIRELQNEYDKIKGESNGTNH